MLSTTIRVRSVAIGALVCLMSALGAGPAKAVPTFTVYTGAGSAADWLAAVGGAGNVTLENFNNAVLVPGLSIVFLGPNHDESLDNDMLNDRVTPAGGGDPAGRTRFEFSTPIYAFGGIWDLEGPGGPGTGINVFVTGGFGVSINPSINRGFSGRFWGFTSDTPFTEVLLRADGQSGHQETYTLDNLVYAPVPEPGTMILLGSGILGLALKRRRSL